MPDPSEIAKARKQFSPQAWRELFGDLLKDPEKAEQITIAMMALRGMMIGGWPWWKVAGHAINNAIIACRPFVRPDVLSEKIREERRSK
ncbi:MAG: hypothetical protein DMF61_26615 [Blastocatellia bacterium AA13]|nr:MAG: hypothetical protein DMF61_26615 [Blastocatellia bacterium AA13]